MENFIVRRIAKEKISFASVTEADATDRVGYCATILVYRCHRSTPRYSRRAHCVLILSEVRWRVQDEKKGPGIEARSVFFMNVIFNCKTGTRIR